MQRPITSHQKKLSALCAIVGAESSSKELEKIEVEYDQVEGLPTDNFKENDAVLLWQKYTEELLDKGKKSVASISGINSFVFLSFKINPESTWS